MGFTFNIKTKTAGSYTSQKVTREDGKKISQLVTTSIEQQVAGLVGNAVAETVAQHNRNVIAKTAIFFQRVVSRTPKDEDYYDSYYHKSHKADKDDVWKEWKVLYWRKSVTAEQMGLNLFDKAEDFNNKTKINAVMKIIINSLFGGEEKLVKRATRIRSIRIENTHPRFAMLEYGEYENTKRDNFDERHGSARISGIKRGGMSGKYIHGTVGGYSVQAPTGMLRITQAEMETMNIADFDKWFSSNYKRNNKNVKKVPSAQETKKIMTVIKNRRNLSDSDIEAILKAYSDEMRAEGLE